MFDAEAPQERTLDGGGRKGPSVSRFSWGSSSEEGGGGPWAPSTPQCTDSLEDVDGSSVLFFCCGLGFCHLLIVSRFFCLWGWGSCLIFKPFKPLPVFWFLSVSLLFCVWFCFRRRRVFSCLLFLSGAGETQTPFGGVWVSPCVFFVQKRVRPLRTRTLTSAPTPWATPPRLPFFCFSFSPSSSLVFLVLVFSRFCPRGAVFLLGLFSGGGSLHAFLDNPNA